MQVCLLVSGLPPDTALTFVLLKGAAYSVASPESTLAQDLAFPITSTLRFTIPLPWLEPWNLRTRKRSDLDNEGVFSTYLALWLPHGLSSNTSAEDFAAAIAVEEIPAPWGGPKSPIPLSISVNLTDARSCVHQPVGLLLMCCTGIVRSTFCALNRNCEDHHSQFCGVIASVPTFPWPLIVGPPCYHPLS
jgi:hypothetical protein